jgi:ubiquinone/menaquinone biosynthesis C-methylase UbiE
MLGAVERYVIRGGREGYSRLLLLARASWPDTAALFSRARIRPGMKCVDLGCGGGEVSLEMARLVGPGGSVTGVELAWSTLDAVSEAILSEGVATSGELAAALASLRQFTDDQTTLIARPRVFQLWSAREPA